MKFSMTRRVVMAAAAATLAFANPGLAGGHQVLEEVHFLIPGDAGGGWDGTARGTGEALTASGLVGSASYEKMSGGGGGVAIAHLIENALQGRFIKDFLKHVVRDQVGRNPMICHI